MVGHVGDDRHARDMDFLSSYASKQWEVCVCRPLGKGKVIRVIVMQWTPSNLATLGTCQSVLIRGVVSFQG